MSCPFSGCRTFSPISFVGFRSRAAVQALFSATRIEEMGAPSMRANAMSSPWESATATTTALFRPPAFSTMRSIIFLASKYSMTGTFRMGRTNLANEGANTAWKELPPRKTKSLRAKKTGWAFCPARRILHYLENKLQRKLNQTWIGVAVVRRNLSEPVIPSSGVGTVEAGAWDTKLRVIEQIEELRTEFKSESFSDGRALKYGPIEVVDSGSAQRGIHTRFGTITPCRRCCKAIDVEKLCKAAAASLAASGYNVGTNVAYAEASIFQRSGGASPGDLKWETPLEGGDAIDSPSRYQFVFNSRRVGKPCFAVSKRKIEHVADDQTLRHILGRKRSFSVQIVIVLHLANAACFARSFEPAGKRVSVAQELRVRVRHQQRAAAAESAGYSGLQRIVRATAASVPCQAQSGVLRVWAKQLSSKNSGSA